MATVPINKSNVKGGGRHTSLVKVLVNKGTLLSEVRPLLLFAIVSQTSRECVVEGEMYHMWKYVYGARKSKFMLRPCVSVLNLRIRVCSCINLFESLAKSPFNIRHSRSEIEWSDLLKCLATGRPLLLSRMLFL